MPENNSEPPDSPSYVQDAEASQIIRDTLDNYEAELKAHSKESPSSIVRSGSGSFVFTTACPKVTPSSTIRENDLLAPPLPGVPIPHACQIVPPLGTSHHH